VESIFFSRKLESEKCEFLDPIIHTYLYAEIKNWHENPILKKFHNIKIGILVEDTWKMQMERFVSACMQRKPKTFVIVSLL